MVDLIITVGVSAIILAMIVGASIMAVLVLSVPFSKGEDLGGRIAGGVFGFMFVGCALALGGLMVRYVIGMMS